MIAKVVPFVRLPREIDFFDYRIPKECGSIQKGSRVSVPFRKRLIDGIVWDIVQDDGTRPVKDIAEVFPSPPLSKNLFRLVNWAAEYYACSRSLILPLVCSPRLLRKKKEAIDLRAVTTPLQTRLRIASRISIHRWTDYAWRNAFLKATVKRHVRNNEQLMILCPTIQSVREVGSLFKKMKGCICEYTSGLSRSKEVAMRGDLFSGRVDVAIGTRILVFADMPRLSTILVDMAHRDEHAQYDMNPRYDARTIAAWRSEHEGVQLILTSPTPRLDDWQEILEEKGETREHLVPVQKTRIVELRDVWRSGQKGFISEILAQETLRAFQAGKDAFYLVNRRGYASQMICGECDWVFTCSACHYPLPGVRGSGHVLCRMCTTSSPIPGRCPTCGTVRFLFPGMGIEKIAEQVRALFPDTDCIQLSSDTMNTPLAVSYRAKRSARRTIVIGTALIPEEYGALFNRFGAIGVIAADSVSPQLNFRACEQQWRFLRTVFMLAHRYEIELIVQAFSPRSAFMEDVLSDNYRRFAQRELSERKKFQWPPFGRCIILIPRQSRDNKHLSVEGVVRDLRDRFANNGATVLVLLRGTQEERILVRFPSRTNRTVSAEMAALYTSIPSEWLVDTDPLSL